MKDFTTAEYIDPVIAVFKALYHPITDKSVCDALNCDLVMQSNHSRNAFCVRAGEPFYTSVANDVYKQIKDYAEYASTEDGELDGWGWNEQQRVQHKIRDRLIEIYT
jgi:hypothetical protein